MMVIENINALITLNTTSSNEAKKLKKVLDPDDDINPPMTISIHIAGKKTVVVIESCPKIGTLLTTIEEILRMVKLSSDTSQKLK